MDRHSESKWGERERQRKREGMGKHYHKVLKSVYKHWCL